MIKKLFLYETAGKRSQRQTLAEVSQKRIAKHSGSLYVTLTYFGFAC